MDNTRSPHWMQGQFLALANSPAGIVWKIGDVRLSSSRGHERVLMAKVTNARQPHGRYELVSVPQLRRYLDSGFFELRHSFEEVVCESRKSK